MGRLSIYVNVKLHSILSNHKAYFISFQLLINGDKKNVMIILVQCVSAFRHEFAEHPSIKAGSTVTYNEGPERGISKPLKLLI